MTAVQKRLNEAPAPPVFVPDTAFRAESFGVPEERAGYICRRFPVFVEQFSQARRKRGQTRLTVKDEYDVQDFLLALFTMFFEKVKREEPTPSLAGAATRIDFLLVDERIAVEGKHTGTKLRNVDVKRQLLDDIATYRKHPGVGHLICLVYDPEKRIENPRGFETDLAGMRTDDLLVWVIVAS